MKKSTTQILIVILFSIITVSCKEKKEVSQVEETAVEKKIVRNIEPGNGMSIAFVNSDTVSKYYEFAKKIQKTLTSKRLEAENQIKINILHTNV